MAKEVEEASEQMKVSGLCLCCVSYPVLYKSKTVSPVLCLCFFTKEWALTKFIEAMKHASLTCEDACFPSQVLEWVKMLWGVRQCVEEADGEVDEQRGDVLQTD